VKAVLAVDDRSVTLEQSAEIAMLKAEILRELGDVFDFVVHDPVRMIQAPPADLTVVDFGGLGISYGGGATAFAEQAARGLAKLIEDRPGRLFMVWSAYTVQWYLGEMAEILERATGRDDVTSTDARKNLPENVILYGEDGAWDRARGWLGLEKPAWESISAKLDALDAEAYGEAAEEPEPAPATEPEPEPEPAEPADDFGDGVEEGPSPLEVYREDRAKACEERGLTPEEAIAEKPFRRPRMAQPDEDPNGSPQSGSLYPRVHDKVPIGYIAVPVYANGYPGRNPHRAQFALQDCIVDVNEGEGEDERRIGAIGGEFLGSYKIHFDPVGPQDAGCGFTYGLDPRDIWHAIQPLHAAFSRQVLADLPAEEAAE
jgi:hypothetical protein